MRYALQCMLAAELLCLATAAGAEKPQAPPKTGPCYFLAIHNEPFHTPDGQLRLAESYDVLRQMVAKADDYGMRLTLMFAPPWADYVLADAGRKAELTQWKSRGHEIAAHHHSIYHGNWDGYTAGSREEAQAARRSRVQQPEAYLGTLDDFLDRVRRLDPQIRCGCMNDEGRKQALPDGIVFDTCSGFANFGPPGRPLADEVPEKGVNEYVSTGTVNGIARRWLCHFQTTTTKRVDAAQQQFSKMSSGVYGSVNHSSPREWPAMAAWLDYLHAQDPGGRRCRTVSEVIRQHLLPDKQIPDSVLHALPTPAGPPRLTPDIARTLQEFKRLLEERRAAGADVAEADRLDRASREAMRQGRPEECLRLLRSALAALKESKPER